MIISEVIESIRILKPRTSKFDVRSGLIFFYPDYFESNVKSYKMKRGRLILYADETGKPVPPEWKKHGVTLSYQDYGGETDNCYTVYNFLIGDKTGLPLPE